MNYFNNPLIFAFAENFVTIQKIINPSDFYFIIINTSLLWNSALTLMVKLV